MPQTKRFRLVAVACAMLLAAASADAGLILVGGVGRGSPTNPGALVDVDPATAIGTLIGDTVTTGGLTGVAFDSSGRLFGSSISDGSRTSSLLEIDPLTGGALSSVTITREGVEISIGDLAIQPGTNTIYGIQSNSDFTSFSGGTLYTIDPTTGVVTVIGDTLTGRGGGLAFAPDGTLYYLEFNELHVLDPLTASILSTTLLDFGSHDGLGIHPDGTLYATGAGVAADMIRIVDPILGTSTLLGSTGVGHLSDLAFFSNEVPVPGTIFLLGIGLGTLAVRRSQRRD